MEVNTYYVYRHIRLDTNTPFYVGKGKKDRAYRKDRSGLWHNVAKKAGYEVEIFLENLTEEQAFEKEREFIKLYRDCGYKLANLTDGGEGQSGCKRSPESIEKSRQAKLGKPRPPGHMSKMWEAKLGKPVTEETKEKMRLAKLGKKRAPYKTYKRKDNI